MKMRQHKPLWLMMLEYRVRKLFTNPDIAFGVFIGSSVTSIVWLIISGVIL